MKWGYLVVEDAITQAQVDLLRTALDETFSAAERSLPTKLLEEDDRFAFLLDHPPVLARA